MSNAQNAKPAAKTAIQNAWNTECQTPRMPNRPGCQILGMLNVECKLAYRFLCIVWHFMYSGTQGAPIFCRINCIVLSYSEESWFRRRLHLILRSWFLTQKHIALLEYGPFYRRWVAPVCHHTYVFVSDFNGICNGFGVPWSAFILKFRLKITHLSENCIDIDTAVFTCCQP